MNRTLPIVGHYAMNARPAVKAPNGHHNCLSTINPIYLRQNRRKRYCAVSATGVIDGAKEYAKKACVIISEKAGEIKESAVDIKADIEEKLYELDRMLESSITEYNDAYTLMNL